MAVITGKEALMQLLRYEGVEYVFGLPGSTELLFLDALEDHPEMKYILGLHEVVAMSMAEGYTRISGKVGVVNLHTCAGLAAATPALFNARLGGVPLLVTAGQQDTRLFMQEPHLTGDLTGIAGHFTKWSTEISHAADIPIAINRAFKVATQPPTGPVFVSLPQEIMNDSLDFEYIPGTPPYNGIRPDSEAVSRAAELLYQAKNPAIIVEAGVARNDALSETVRLAELIGARVYQAWMGDVNFPTGHPQYAGDFPAGNPATREMLKSVDVLVAVGAPVFGLPVYLPQPLLTAATAVVQIDDNPWEIAKNHPVAAGITGNIKLSLTELNNAISSIMTAQAREAVKARIARIAGEKEEIKQAFLDKASREKDRVPVSVSRLMQELKDALRPGTLIIDEACSASGTMKQMIDFNEPMDYKGPRGGGSIGWGMPAALGAKLGAPERPVVAVIGDGSAMWSIQSLWTASHYHIPVTFIICDNAGYMTLKSAKKFRVGEKAEERNLGMAFNEPGISFHQMARAMGVIGQRVERPEELGDVLKTALNSDEPNLIEVCLADRF